MNALRLAAVISTFILFSCNHTVLKSPIVESIAEGDTLTLSARYSECGEWGGHIEKLYLTRKANDLWITLYIDTVTCDGNPNATRKQIIDKTKKLKTEDETSVVMYIDKFMVDSKKDNFPLGNSSHSFMIINKDTTLQFIDWSEQWREFKTLRQTIFNEIKINRSSPPR